MKAFLSDRTSRDERTPDAWTMGDLGVAWNAEREARAILAVTEPDGCGTHQRLTWLGDWSADMAESVALFLGQAFPGEQCHCAAGHHWSPERGYFDCGGIVPA